MEPKQQTLISPQMTLDGVFPDMVSFGAATGGWDMNCRQLDAGPLAASAKLVVARGSAALRVRLNRKLHQQGSPPPGPVVLGLPDEPIVWCGTQATAGQVLNFNLAGGFEGVSEPGFRGNVLLVDPAEMELRAAELGLDIDLRTRLRISTTWVASPHRIERLRGRLARMFRDTEPLGFSTRAEQLMNHDLAGELVQAITAGEPQPGICEPSNRRRALRVALELIEASRDLPPSVVDLCRAADVSPRTLYRAFREEFGISPKRYLQLRRLTGVRNELLRASRDSRVFHIANRWGFWHMSQFAADYRRQFGERPSETLARVS